MSSVASLSFFFCHSCGCSRLLLDLMAAQELARFGVCDCTTCRHSSWWAWPKHGRCRPLSAPATNISGVFPRPTRSPCLRRTAFCGTQCAWTCPKKDASNKTTCQTLVAPKRKRGTAPLRSAGRICSCTILSCRHKRIRRKNNLHLLARSVPRLCDQSEDRLWKHGGPGKGRLEPLLSTFDSILDSFFGFVSINPHYVYHQLRVLEENCLVTEKFQNSKEIMTSIGFTSLGCCCR